MNTAVFMFLLLCQDAIAYVYSTKNGVSLSYQISLRSKCHGEEDRFGVFQGIPLPDCVHKCCVSTECVSLNYWRRYHLCEMFSSVAGLQADTGPCVYMNRADIEILQNGNWNGTQYCDGVTNVAYMKETTISSTHSCATPCGARGVDGNTNQRHWSLSCFHTDKEASPWWRVDLGGVYKIFDVILYNRKDCCSERSTNIQVTAGTSLDSMVVVGLVPGQIADIQHFNLHDNPEARFVQVTLLRDDVLNMCEVEVLGILSITKSEL